MRRMLEVFEGERLGLDRWIRDVTKAVVHFAVQVPFAALPGFNPESVGSSKFYLSEQHSFSTACRIATYLYAHCEHPS